MDDGGRSQFSSGTGTTGSGLAPNIAAALSYVLGLITGIVFILIEKEDQFVRFHAWQSILLSVALIALSIAISIVAIIPILGWIIAFIFAIVYPLVVLVLWVLLIVKAFQGAKWKLPYIGDMAEKYATKSPF